MDEHWVNSYWMSNRVDPIMKSSRNEFCVGLSEFINFAINQEPRWKEGDNIRVSMCKMQKYEVHPSK